MTDTDATRPPAVRAGVAGSPAGPAAGRSRPGAAATRNGLRLAAHVLVACLPRPLKLFCYRYIFRFRVGRGVRIGFAILDVDRCTIGEHARIGHFNVFTRIHELDIGPHVRIGFANLFRGGALVRLGAYAECLRLNQINAIPEPDCLGTPESVFILGEGGVVTAEHRFDFTDRIEIGKCVVIGGRNSSFWTHNRQATLPIRIGDFSYIGSEVRFAPGARVPAWCIVGIGSVIASPLVGERCLIAGVPARVIRSLSEADLASLRRKPRADLPDAFYEGIPFPPTSSLDPR